MFIVFVFCLVNTARYFIHTSDGFRPGELHLSLRSSDRNDRAEKSYSKASEKALRDVNLTLASILNDIRQSQWSVTSLTLAPSPEKNEEPKPQEVFTKAKQTKKRAVIFTMDAFGGYEADSLRGGAAGELIVRHSLEYALSLLGVSVSVLRGDKEFEHYDLQHADYILLDPWTWAGKGWVLKPQLRGLESRIYLLDFFGAAPGTKQRTALHIDPMRILTAFGSPWNTFLGYFISNDTESAVSEKALQKKRQGVIWGKDPKHFIGREKMLRDLAQYDASLVLVSTATGSAKAMRLPSNVHMRGHLSREQWRTLLAESAFLLGLGTPLLGPSAIDAISLGCVYLNPLVKDKDRPWVASQHPYAQNSIGPPYVCSYLPSSREGLKNCVRTALELQETRNLSAHIPEAFSLESYLSRVKVIFQL